MPLLKSANRQRRSHTPTTSTQQQQRQQQQQQQQQQTSRLLSRLPLNASTPAVYFSSNSTGTSTSSASNPGNVLIQPRVNRSTGYHHRTGSGSSMQGVMAPPPYDLMVPHSPTPTPSTSWTSEMSMLADKIRDDAAALSDGSGVDHNLDRRSISQGMKLVAIAADEYDDGNKTVALDIYLSGIDKILMALPNKTDPRTKFALREKLTSVEERVGILTMASRQRRLQQEGNEDEFDEAPAPSSSLMRNLGLSRITTTISTITTIATSRVYSQPQPVPDASSPSLRDPIYRFKRFAQIVINTTVTCAILIKQSPLPDIVYFLFGYLVQMLLWVDGQYHIAQKAQDFGIECVKLLLRADEQYRLHEFASEAMYMFVAAGLKAAVAYKEAPGFREPEEQRIEILEDDELEEVQEEIEMYPTSSPPPVPPKDGPTTSSSRIPWIWSPWH